MTPRAMLLALPLAALSIAPFRSAILPSQLLPIYGGSGGTAFSRDCGAGKVLTGLRYRAGLLVDAVGLLCSPVLSNGALGPETTVGSLAGGGGGTSGAVSCASGNVVRQARIWHGSFVNGIQIVCKTWDAGSRKWLGADQYPARVGRNDTLNSDAESCTAPTQPASGIRGRASALVDAIGFICDEP